VIYVSDAGANSIRAYGRRFAAFWETVSGNERGTFDGNLYQARFNRPANLAVDKTGNLFLADSANKLVRVISAQNQAFGQPIPSETARNLFLSTEEMRRGGVPRWTYDPPENPRDIAGTFGELRGEIKTPTDYARFHNGLDIAGGYGETARFIRDEKVLRPFATENYGTSRELLRMPTLGYIHIRLGRDSSEKPFADERFLWSRDEKQKLNGVRIPRGAKFKAGEAIGTLNSMNHVHMIAGETGAEMNALDALVLPGVKDTVAPTIEKIILFDENWQEVKTDRPIRGKIRIVARAYDQMDGNNSRRRLGAYRLGYQILSANGDAASEQLETISFERLPSSEVANLVYAIGSQSGATGETVFNYIVSNQIKAGEAREDFFDTAKFGSGDYKIRVFVSDFFGNQSTRETLIRIQN
jgi:hypothetical protein